MSVNNYIIIWNRKKDREKQRERGKEREREWTAQAELLSYFHSWHMRESSQDVWNPVNGHYCSYEDACNNYGAEDLLLITDSALLMSRELCNKNCNQTHYLILNNYSIYLSLSD